MDAKDTAQTRSDGATRCTSPHPALLFLFAFGTFAVMAVAAWALWRYL